MRRVLAFLGMLALALASMVAPAAKAHAASNVSVYVGYADDARANPADFPTPWAGSPDVDYAGCTGCGLDSGAVRIVNNTSIGVTVDYVKVRFGTCVFDLWPHDRALASGRQLIVAQTIASPSGGCPGDGSFDTSDVGPDGVNWAGNCTQSGVVPVVDVSIDGVLTSYDDAKQVLNTKGVDAVSCGMSNESEQWTPIGTSCPGAVLSLAPVTQTQAVGSTATVKATLANSCGDPLQGAAVAFAVTGGPDSGKTGAGTTDAAGAATFGYSGGTLGTDTVVATVTNPAGTITSNDVTVVWQASPTTLTITGGAAGGDFDDPATVAATLRDNLGPVSGQTVVFTLDGAETCSGVTDASGSASCSLTPKEAAGGYPLTAGFAGSATDLPATASAPFTVNHEETTLTYTGSTHAANGQSYTLSGTLREDGAAPIAGRTVAFTLGSGTSAQTCSATTDASGDAACTVVVHQSTASVPASGTFAGDAFYLGSTAGVNVGLTVMTGHAYGLAVSGLLNVAPLPEVGPVATPTASKSAQCVLGLNTLIEADTLCASVVTSVDPGSSTATASVERVGVGLPLLPVIEVTAVRSTSMTTCSRSSGDTTIASITIGGIPVPVSLHPGPNTTIDVLGVKVILNEQIASSTATDRSLEVNAVHLSVPGLLDVKIASSTSDIHHCV